MPKTYTSTKLTLGTIANELTYLTVLSEFDKEDKEHSFTIDVENFKGESLLEENSIFLSKSQIRTLINYLKAAIDEDQL